MSPKKKSAARIIAQTKDELIDALLQSDGDDGPASLEERLNTVTRGAQNDGDTRSRISLAKPPPPPPPAPPRRAPPENESSQERGEHAFNFDGDTAAIDVESMSEGLELAPELHLELPTYEDLDADSAENQVSSAESSAPYDIEQASELKGGAPSPPPAKRRDQRTTPFDALRVEPRPPGEKRIFPPPSEEEVEPQEASVRAVTKSVSMKLESALKRLRAEVVHEVPAPVSLELMTPVVSEAVPAAAAHQKAVPQAAVPPAAVPQAAVPPLADDDEKTVPIAPWRPTTKPLIVPDWQDVKTEVLHTRSRTSEADPGGEAVMPTEIRAGSPGARFRTDAKQIQPGAAIFSSAEAVLRQSENLRVAQKRISDLERELERVRRENENFRSAGETLRRRLDELQARAESSDVNVQEIRKIADEEKKVLRGQITSRDRDLADLRGRLDDAEGRLEANFRKIRVRERDLEHRVEIIKAESQSIAASKDRMILELKRQVDQVTAELGRSKSQVQETYGQFKERQETVRRAVRALRIALTVLEGEDDSGSRKAE